MKIRKILSALLFAAVLVCALCACSNSNGFSGGEVLSDGYKRSDDVSKTYNFNDGAEDLPSAYNSYANLITGYELKLFRALAADSSEPFAFSPACNALDLSLIANGAKGDTLSEIMLALGTDLSLENLNACSSYFKSRLEAVSKIGENKTDELSGKKLSEGSAAKIDFDSALLFNSRTDVRTAFLQSNADFYGDDIVRLDFSNENAVSSLSALFGGNSAANKTALDKASSLVSESSVGFSDLWLNPYAADDIYEGKFADKTAEFMKSDESFIQSSTARGIIKYTAKNPLKLVLIMPNEDIEFESYAKTFDSVEYMKLLDSFSVTSRASASVPQFEIPAFDEPFAMSGVMKKSGLYTLFSDSTDFGSLAHSSELVLGEMYELRQGFCLNRDGIFTSAEKPSESSVSQPRENPADSGSGKAEELVFDRPFIFMVIDNESNIPVYMGVCSKI